MACSSTKGHLSSRANVSKDELCIVLDRTCEAKHELSQCCAPNLHFAVASTADHHK